MQSVFCRVDVFVAILVADQIILPISCLLVISARGFRRCWNGPGCGDRHHSTLKSSSPIHEIHPPSPNATFSGGGIAESDAPLHPVPPFPHLSPQLPCRMNLPNTCFQAARCARHVHVRQWRPSEKVSIWILRIPIGTRRCSDRRQGRWAFFLAAYSVGGTA